MSRGDAVVAPPAHVDRSVVGARPTLGSADGRAASTNAATLSGIVLRQLDAPRDEQEVRDERLVMHRASIARACRPARLRRP